MVQPFPACIQLCDEQACPLLTLLPSSPCGGSMLGRAHSRLHGLQHSAAPCHAAE